MLAILGFVLYGILALAIVTVDTIGGMIDQALILAFELSVGMFALYFYPLILAAVLFGLKLREPKHRDLLSKQTNISASVAVSLGLIGTFQGLTAMVSSIAASMGGEGDITEKMGAMINAISDALNAMSYAFLTSILGVAVSVLLILSLNFWMFGFKKEPEAKPEDEDEAAAAKIAMQQLAAKDPDEVVDVLKVVGRLLQEILKSNKEQAETFNEFVRSQDQSQLIETLNNFVALQQEVAQELKASAKALSSQDQSHMVNTLNTFVEAQREISEGLKNSQGDLSALVKALEAQHGNRADELALAILNELSKVEQANVSLLAKLESLSETVIIKMDESNEHTRLHSEGQRELITALSQQQQRVQALMQAMI